MQITRPRSTKKLRRSHEQVSDIEYIIPRVNHFGNSVPKFFSPILLQRKSSKPSNSSAFNAYAQSWVFDSEDGSYSNHTSSPYTKVSQNGTPKTVVEKPKIDNDVNDFVSDGANVVENPVVHIEEASDDSTSNSTSKVFNRTSWCDNAVFVGDRKLNYMKSFSRSASPAVLSASSSQISLTGHMINNPPIYECLERLTEPSVYRSRLNSALSNKEQQEDECHYQAPQLMKRPEVTTPQGEKVQYASLMKELQRAIVKKKEPSITSPPSTSDSATNPSNRKDSDADFSKELEAALQLIQDLESPNTVETPSDIKDSRPLAVWKNSGIGDSDKTLNAVGSVPELTSPLAEYQPDLGSFKSNKGKGARVYVHSDSQSTSGYSSPTRKSGSHISTSSHSPTDFNKTLAYSIHNTKSTAVISLYSQDTLKSKSRSVTLVTISGDNQPVESPSSPTADDVKNNNYHHSDEVVKRSPSSTGSGTLWNVKSILRKKKTQELPKLSPELEDAIFKSESLAYLSEKELVARHDRNKDIERVR